MTYTDIINYAKQGKICKLPEFEGYFKWDYITDQLIFYNEDFKCPAKDLYVEERDDFYYII